MAVLTTFARSEGDQAVGRLIELLGQASVAGLDEAHPLSRPFRARARASAGGVLTRGQSQRVAELEAAAIMLTGHEPEWKNHRRHLRDLLLSATDVGALLFELEVGEYLERASGQRWLWARFERGTPDWIAEGNDIGVECHRALSVDKLEEYGKTLSKKAHQHRNWNRPLVIALGFVGAPSNKTLLKMPSQAERHLPWMTRHKEVSAVLVVGRQPLPRPARTPPGGLQFRSQQCIEIRNVDALHPIRQGLLGDGDEVFRHTFPGPMKSFTEPAHAVIGKE